MTPMVWRSTEDDADDWTIESPDLAVYGTLADIAARLPGGDYYLAERDGDDEPWVIVTADGENEVAQCPTEEEAVALIGALRHRHRHEWLLTATEVRTVFYAVERDEDGTWVASYVESDDEDTTDVQPPRCRTCGEVADIDPDVILIM